MNEFLKENFVKINSHFAKQNNKQFLNPKIYISYGQEFEVANNLMDQDLCLDIF